jgi:uncharacterized protein (TIGR00725 family)
MEYHMDVWRRKPTVGVMGSAQETLSEADWAHLAEVAESLGRAIVDQDCTLITGETTGLPDLVTQAVRKHRGFTVGISPAHSFEEHQERYGFPQQGSDVVIYTGFGYKGRNVINIRSSDIVVIFRGGIGTLNEFTIAYDEGKIIGILEGTGGVADHVGEIVHTLAKKTQAALCFERDAVQLLTRCLAELARRRGSYVLEGE